MTTQLLASELANLIQESKRKHNDLRQVRDTVAHCALPVVGGSLQAALFIVHRPDMPL
jgi:hypothetical protein